MEKRLSLHERSKAERQQEKEHRTKELTFARETIEDIYIHGRLDINTATERANTLSENLGEKTRNQRMAELSLRMEQIKGDYEDGIETIFTLVDASPQERYEIRAQTLQGAKTYWESRLSQARSNPTEETLGLMRMTDISKKMANLEKSIKQRKLFKPTE